MNKRIRELIIIFGLIAIGVVAGICLSWAFIYVQVDSIVNNVLPKITIENINLDLNETELTRGLSDIINQTVLEQSE